MDEESKVDGTNHSESRQAISYTIIVKLIPMGYETEKQAGI